MTANIVDVKSESRNALSVLLVSTPLKMLFDFFQNPVCTDMEFKKLKLGTKRNEKRLQVLLTVHEKQRRGGTINSVPVAFDKLVRNPVTRQQCWVTYLKQERSNLSGLQTCRFLKIQTRLAKILLGDEPPNPIEAYGVFVYGGSYGMYLYLEKPRADMCVSFQNNTYVKFPEKYAVMQDATGQQLTGKLSPAFEKMEYATLCDLRTYSNSFGAFLRKPDPPELKALLNPVGNLQNLWKAPDWVSTDDCRHNVWSFLGGKGVGGKFQHACYPKPFIDDRLLDPTAWQCMYTLPDLLTTNAVKSAEFENIQIVSKALVNKTFLEDLKKAEAANDENSKQVLWNELRGSTHFIETNKVGDVSYVMKDFNLSIDNDVLRPILQRIRTQVLPKTNEDA